MVGCAIIAGPNYVKMQTDMQVILFTELPFSIRDRSTKSMLGMCFRAISGAFLEVEQFIFGERSQMIVDPAEEKLKNEFSSIKRSFIPMQSVVRIDEVEKEGAW